MERQLFLKKHFNSDHILTMKTQTLFLKKIELTFKREALQEDESPSRLLQGGRRFINLALYILIMEKCFSS